MRRAFQPQRIWVVVNVPSAPLTEVELDAHAQGHPLPRGINIKTERWPVDSWVTPPTQNQFQSAMAAATRQGEDACRVMPGATFRIEQELLPTPERLGVFGTGGKLFERLREQRAAKATSLFVTPTGEVTANLVRILARFPTAEAALEALAIFGFARIEGTPGTYVRVEAPALAPPLPSSRGQKVRARAGLTGAYREPSGERRRVSGARLRGPRQVRPG